MKPESFVLTFIVNASWQLVVIAAAARACRGVIARMSSRMQCWFWSAALAVSVLLPLACAAIAVSGHETAMKVLQLRPDTLEKWCVAFGAAVAASIVVTARRWAATRRLVQPMPRPGERTRAIAARCAEVLGTGPVPIWISNTLASPVTFGARRPVIVVPLHLDADVVPDALLQTALGHELAHVRRRDFAWSMLCEMLTVPIAWHPVIGWLKRNIAVAREMACDDLVAGSLVDRRVYAESLLSIARMAMHGRTPRGALGVVDGGHLQARIDHLLDRRSSGRHAAWSASSFVLLIAIAVGCQRWAVSIDRCYLHPPAASARVIDLCLRFPWMG